MTPESNHPEKVKVERLRTQIVGTTHAPKKLKERIPERSKDGLMDEGEMICEGKG